MQRSLTTHPSGKRSPAHLSTNSRNRSSMRYGRRTSRARTQVELASIGVYGKTQVLAQLVACARGHVVGVGRRGDGGHNLVGAARGGLGGGAAGRDLVARLCRADLDLRRAAALAFGARRGWA